MTVIIHRTNASAVQIVDVAVANSSVAVKYILDSCRLIAKTVGDVEIDYSLACLGDVAQREDVSVMP